MIEKDNSTRYFASMSQAYLENLAFEKKDVLLLSYFLPNLRANAIYYILTVMLCLVDSLETMYSVPHVCLVKCLPHDPQVTTSNSSSPLFGYFGVQFTAIDNLSS